MSNMYPDLDDQKQKENYNATGTTTTGQKKKKKTTTTTTTTTKNKTPHPQDTCCILGAKIWVCIIGILCCVLGLFVTAASLYAKYGYSGYAALSNTLPVGGIWMVLGFGVTLTLCSIALILSACCYQNGFFKIILVVFAIVLSLLLIMEVVSGSFMVWSLGILALPQSEVSDAIVDRLLIARNLTSYGTWQECCIVNTPPYSLQNMSKIDSACLWPNTADVVKQACGSTNVFVCVCSDPTKYASEFGRFLQSKLSWVGGVTIAFALLILIGLIATCVLIWGKRKRDENMYHADAGN